MCDLMLFLILILSARSSSGYTLRITFPPGISFERCPQSTQSKQITKDTALSWGNLPQSEIRNQTSCRPLNFTEAKTNPEFDQKSWRALKRSRLSEEFPRDPGRNLSSPVLENSGMIPN